MVTGDGRDLFSLAGRTALVTGSVRGIGLVVAQALGRAGASVILNGRHAETVAVAVEKLQDEGIDADPFVADMAQPGVSEQMLSAVGERTDILVNTIGARDRRGTGEMATNEFRVVVELDLVSIYGISAAVSRQMVARGCQGRIINISSVVGHLGKRGDVAYSAAKSGLEGLTRAMAADLGPHGITVNAIAPGCIATPANRELVEDPKWRDWLVRRTMLGRWGRPEELAGVVVALASDAGSFITGQTIDVDGGMSVTF
ncbi:gluconate 5-dehydrogenase [Propionibacterium cyclohexanicum]|uniref:Gluconate 5-dehydrogenase n=1 Tax=Propionibacterium cyclohexanicum TaxID=64702 RepID=A0A1H9T379_9ACTN|nr:SDR family oxidoreductase [Propionibacterium cyclohexanicum]SER91576.1 gluconate 5-dehydrogenase [Propionibacterium cyclohexanicum]